MEKGVVPRYAKLSNIYNYYPLEFNINSDPTIQSHTEFNGYEESYTSTSMFWILLSNPYHLLEDEPVTAGAALRKADTDLAKDPDNVRNKQLRRAAQKEYIIEHLLSNTKAEDKGNFINRWVLHKLRISPGEVELMYSSFISETGLPVHDIIR